MRLRLCFSSKSARLDSAILERRTMRHATSIELLLVEDHPGDVRLTKEAFHRCGTLRLHHAWDGAEAMAFLRQEHVYADAPRPDLIMLDLNMPRMGGHETLAQIKGDPNLKAIPTIVFTSSDSEADILTCYRLGANCCLRKPLDWEAFDHLLTSIDTFWLKAAQLPRAGAAAIRSSLSELSSG
jgi:two-component system, chemotaxis family, response regulator Rcp1